MKKIFGFILAITLLLVPYAGFMFLFSVVVAGVAFFFKIGPVILAGAFLGWAWKTYLCLAIITVFCMTTFSFLHCCVGLNTFSGHILHYGKKHMENVMTGLLWPVSWWLVDKNLKGWYLCWMDVVFGTIEFWLITRWRGVRVDFFNIQSGEQETVFSKSVKESSGFVKDKIAKTKASL